MSVHIAIPEPTSSDTAYNQRSLPQYLFALHAVGATPVLVPLHERPNRVAKLLQGSQGVLLPGSGFDVDPERYGEKRIPECGPADAGRGRVDELLLQDAFNLHKPVLAICHGAQTLNVWLNGSLIQDLKTDLKTGINHAPGRGVIEAHTVQVSPGSRLAGLLQDGGKGVVAVNSSHHQAVRVAGHNLKVAAVSQQDDVIEAVELDSADHFVVGVQWHPERTYTESAFSRAIFSSFIQAAAAWQPRRMEESLAAG
ncbi:MAG: gamma-glutamyl-gamma-aminobutyrate hydrolase family protein [Terracidiphilus sp.]